jgi:hypothetical protein
LAVSLRFRLLSEILRGPGETHSDVILKLVELAGGSSPNTTCDDAQGPG